MPDFERVMDDLAVDLAVTQEQKSYERGFIAGKSRARFEVVAVIVIIYFAVVAVNIIYT